MLQIHVVASLIAILVGLFVLYGTDFHKTVGSLDGDLPRNDHPDQLDWLPLGAVRL